ncbi:MAG: hypothetical protein AAB438_02935 [Patescibacteria group bacterium]
MDIKSLNYWFGVILMDLNLPQNEECGKRFIVEFGKKYALLIDVQFVTCKFGNSRKERLFVKMGSVRQIFQREIRNLIFSIHVTSWKKVNS